jgi:hypothetical protein
MRIRSLDGARDDKLASGATIPGCEVDDIKYL